MGVGESGKKEESREGKRKRRHGIGEGMVGNWRGGGRSGGKDSVSA